MDLRGWDERYRTHPGNECVTPLLATIASRLVPGRAIDLACGAGRNALWLAANGWQVTAVDGSSAAIEIVKARNPAIDARVADLEKHQYVVEPDSWDLIAICYYLQRDLFEPAKRGVVPGGVVIAIAHIPEPADPQMTPFRLAPGELTGYFTARTGLAGHSAPAETHAHSAEPSSVVRAVSSNDFEILHQYEGPSRDPAHRRWVAEIAACRLVAPGT
jgi:SAM-dependent methyltransferase